MKNERVENMYQHAIETTIDAIRADGKAQGRWKDAGANVSAFFETEAALLEVKAQFIADAIIPAIDKHYRDALNKELPRKGSADYNALDQSAKDNWEKANQLKKDARAIAHTYFARVLKYAFPKEAEKAAPRELKTRVCEELIALIKACQKAEDAEFDVIDCIAHMEKALTVASK